MNNIDVVEHDVNRRRYYWSLGALKILFNSALALAVPAVVSRKVVV